MKRFPYFQKAYETFHFQKKGKLSGRNMRKKLNPAETITTIGLKKDSMLCWQGNYFNFNSTSKIHHIKSRQNIGLNSNLQTKQ